MTGNTKAWIGKFGEIGHPYVHPYSKQCGYYVDLSPYALKATFPIGMIVMWYGTTVPNGWAICDGSNGTPDLRDKFIVGAGYSYGKGATGGEKEVILSENELPLHSHRLSSSSSGGWFHYIMMSVDGGLGDDRTEWAVGSIHGGKSSLVNTRGANVQVGSSDAMSSTESVGSNLAHNNLPPYYALYFIMKIS